MFHLQMVPDLLDVITDSLDISVSKLQDTVKDRAAGQAAIHGVAKSLRHDLVTEQHAGSVVKNPPTSVGDGGDRSRSLGWEDALEKGMATPSSILAWEIPWTEEPGGLQFMGSQGV